MNLTNRTVLIALSVISILFIVWYFSHIVIYIIASAVISIIGHPLVLLIEKIKFRSFKIPRSISAIITLFALWFIIYCVFRIVIPLVAFQANQLSAIDPMLLQKNLAPLFKSFSDIIIKLNYVKNTEELQQLINTKIIELLRITEFSKILSYFISLLGNIVIGVFAISFISFFLLKDDKLLYNTILLLTPEKYIDNIKHILKTVYSLLKRYFIGISIDVALIIALITLGMFIIGFSFQQAATIGLAAGIMNVIPYIGPIIGATFGLIIGIASNIHLDFYAQLLPIIGYMIIVFFCVQLLDGILFQPFIYSSSVKAHPLEIFFVIMISGSIAGIPGMILATPTYTIVRVVAKEFFNNLRIVKKLTDKI